MISLFTPMYRIEYLEPLLLSLLQQHFEDWEWVVLPNGPLKSIIQERLKKVGDKRIRLLNLDISQPNIGKLKKTCCNWSKGSVLVEIDDDDRLAPRSLSVIADSFVDRKIDFLYSDTALDCREGFRPYSLACWKYTTKSIDNRTYPILRAFPPSARSLCEIPFIPHHVRAWSRDFYDQIDGHSFHLPSADDHDLCCRTYLNRGRFGYTREPLYIQTVHGEQTSQSETFLQSLSTIETQITDFYLEKLIEEEARRKSWFKYQLSEETPLREGYVSVSLAGKSGVKCDWKKVTSLFDSSAGVIRADHCLHMLENSEIPTFWNEVYRCLIPGGWFVCSIPFWHGPKGEPGYSVDQDPRTRSRWNPNSFWYVTKREYQQRVLGLRARFELVRWRIDYPTNWHRLNKMPYLYAYLLCLKDGESLPGRPEV